MRLGTLAKWVFDVVDMVRKDGCRESEKKKEQDLLCN